MSNGAEVEDRLARVFSQVIELPSGITVQDASMENTPSWDSLVQINLILAVEMEFRVSLSPDHVSAVASFRDMESLVRELL